MPNKNKANIGIDYIVLTFIRVFTIISSFVITRILCESFSLEEYGLYAQSSLIISTVSAITVLGLTDSTNYFFNKYYDNIDARTCYLSSIYTIQIILGVFSAFFLIFTRFYISELFNAPKLANFIIIISLLPLLSNVLSSFIVVYFSLSKSRYIAIRNFIIAICKVFSTLVACYYTRSIETILVFNLVIDLLQYWYFKINLKRNGQSLYFSLKWLRQYCLPIFKFSIPISLYVTCNAFMRDCDRIIVSIFTDSSSVALYSNASKQLPFDLLTASLSTILLPLITKNIANQNYRATASIYAKYITLSYIITGLFLTCAFINSRDIIILLYGEKFSSINDIFLVYLLISFIRFANPSLLFSASGKSLFLMLMTFASFVLNIVVSVVMFCIFGPIGCAIATLLVTIFTDLILYLSTEKMLKISFLPLIDIKYLSFFSLQMLAIYLICSYILELLPVSEYSYLVRLLFSSVLCLGVLYLLNFRQIIHLFRSFKSY